MHPPEHDNRRRWSRFSLETRVALYAAGQLEARAAGRAVDISEGGVSVLTVDRLNIGEQLTIAFSIPQLNQSFRMESVVRTHDGYKYGLEFLKISEADRKELAEFGRVLQILREEQ